MNTLALPRHAWLRVAFYKRVSTDEQSRRDTIAAQDSALHRHYDRHFAADALEPWTLVGDFSDDGVTGVIPLEERPDGSKLINLLRHGELDAVLVARSDRLVRDRQIADQIAEEFWDRGIRIFSTSEHIDLTTPAGRLQFAISTSFSHYERELIRDRTMAGRARRAADGEFINGPVPLGYDVSNNRLVPSARPIEQLGCTEAELVQRIFERVSKGESVLSIMRWLHDVGVPSTRRYYNKRAERYTTFTNPRWSNSRLLQMLNNPLYYGERTLNFTAVGSGRINKTMDPVPQSVPPLVSRDLSKRAEEVREKHQCNYHLPRKGRFPFLLTGKLVCGQCQSAMIGHYRMRQKPRGESFAYVCTQSPGRARSYLTGRICTGMWVKGFNLEELILQQIDTLVANPDQVLEAIRAEQQKQHGPVDGTERRALRQNLGKLERGRDSLRALLKSGDLSAEEFRADAAENAREIASLQQRLAALEAEEAVADALAYQLREAEQKLAVVASEWPRIRSGQTSRADLREFVQALVKRVVVYSEIGGGRRVDSDILFEAGPTDSQESCNYLSIGRPVYHLTARLERAA